MDEYVVIRRDEHGRVIDAQPLIVESVTIESVGFSPDVHQFTIRGHFHPLGHEATAQKSPATDTFLVNYPTLQLPE